ncbi:roadblock/LC7 domain-containing protein [Thermopolyspora sp. NPDC052614]|uniref:roadblock/LC7 domain-containing protein n=1 Tax=Thermopolyspora sp. NPDC052614 TaxID=3155682 RepID=UPI00343B0BBD
MLAIEDCLSEVMAIPGAVDVILVDPTTGMAVTTAGVGAAAGVEQSAAALSETLRATMDGVALATPGGTIRVNDVIVTTDKGHHLLKPVETVFEGPLLIYLRLDGERANIALARHRLTAISGRLVTA